MKANELMIGDWVYCFDPDEPNDKQINKVSAVRVEYNEGAIKFEQFTDWFEEGWFEPIPLTAEILGNNGWKKHIDSTIAYTMDRYIGDVHIWVQFYQEKPHLGLQKFGAGSFELYCYLNHIHELQHALRLCGLNELADSIII